MDTVNTTVTEIDVWTIGMDINVEGDNIDIAALSRAIYRGAGPKNPFGSIMSVAVSDRPAVDLAAPGYSRGLAGRPMGPAPQRW
jgi:hypothetical protein